MPTTPDTEAEEAARVRAELATLRAIHRRRPLYPDESALAERLLAIEQQQQRQP